MVRDLDQAVVDCIIFMDEKTLQSFHSARVRVYRRRGRSDRRRYVFRRHSSANFKINLVGWMSKSGIGDLWVIDNACDSEHFVNYLNEEILPSIIDRVGTNFVLAFDNCSFHKSNLTYEYLMRTNVKLMAWPPQSPEFNLIKNLWAILQARVNTLIFNEGNPFTLDDLIILAFRAWYSIEPEIVSNCYDSFLSRVHDFLSKVAEDELLERQQQV